MTYAIMMCVFIFFLVSVEFVERHVQFQHIHFCRSESAHQWFLNRLLYEVLDQLHVDVSGGSHFVAPGR